MKYIDIENFIMSNIKNGIYKADDQIPSENQLVKKFEVSRMTVRKAIENLVARNYLYKINGKGTYVINKDEKTTIFLDEMIGFKNRTTKSGHVPSTTVLKFQKKKLNFLIAEKMRLEKNEEVFYVERVRYLDGEPVVLEITYLPYSLYENITENDIKTSKYEYIKNKGFEIYSMEKEYSAILPEKKIQDILKIDSNMPVFKTELISFEKNGNILEYTKLYYNQNKYKFIQVLKNNLKNS